MKQIVLIGCQGMLGQDLRSRLQGSFDCLPVTEEELDISDRDRVLEWFENVRADVLINCAAYTDVDGCETHRDQAMAVNGEAPGYLAEGCSRSGMMMVQVSTDFVFDGTKEGPYTEKDLPNPLSVYGASKLLGEERVAGYLDRFLIVRTSWLYGPGGKNFVEAILRQADNTGALRVVRDQVGSPTYVPDLSEALIDLIGLEATGIVHVSNSGACSWFDFARRILELSGRAQVPVAPITASELDRPARRPANSVLSDGRFFAVTGRRVRRWDEGLRDYLRQR